MKSHSRGSSKEGRFTYYLKRKLWCLLTWSSKSHNNIHNTSPHTWDGSSRWPDDGLGLLESWPSKPVAPFTRLRLLLFPPFVFTYPAAFATAIDSLTFLLRRYDFKNVRILFLTQELKSGNLDCTSAMISLSNSRGCSEIGIWRFSLCSINPFTYAYNKHVTQWYKKWTMLTTKHGNWSSGHGHHCGFYVLNGTWAAYNSTTHSSILTFLSFPVVAGMTPYNHLKVPARWQQVDVCELVCVELVTHLVTAHHTHTAHKNRGINGSPTQRDLKLLLDMSPAYSSLFQEPPVIPMYRMYQCNAIMVTHIKCLCSESICSIGWRWYRARFCVTTVWWAATDSCCLLVVFILAVLYKINRARLTNTPPSISIPRLPARRSPVARQSGIGC